VRVAKATVLALIGEDSANTIRAVDSAILEQIRAKVCWAVCTEGLCTVLGGTVCSETIEAFSFTTSLTTVVQTVVEIGSGAFVVFFLDHRTEVLDDIQKRQELVLEKELEQDCSLL